MTSSIDKDGVETQKQQGYFLLFWSSQAVSLLVSLPNHFVYLGQQPIKIKCLK